MNENLKKNEDNEIHVIRIKKWWWIKIWELRNNNKTSSSIRIEIRLDKKGRKKILWVIFWTYKLALPQDKRGLNERSVLD